ncbi:MAG: hypothetical protein AAF495_04385 [Pseudomonadota bacterium]
MEALRRSSISARCAWQAAGLALGLLLLPGAPAMAQNCQPQDGYSYEVDVTIDTPPVRLHRNLSRAQLTGKTFHGASSGQTLGLMQSSLEVATQTHYFSHVVEGGMCIWVSRIDVTLRYNTLDIFIAKEYRQHSCEYKVILEHEKQHVKVAQQALKPFVPKIISALTSFSIPRAGNPLGVQSLDHAKQQINRRIDERIAPLRNQMTQVINKKQAKVDSPQSYRATFKRCKNW